MAGINETPVGTRIGFRVEDEGVVRIVLADGAVLIVKPVVVDVVKDEDETNYFVQSSMQIIIERPAGAES